MDIDFLLRGLIIGFSIAAPVGPIGILCIRRTLSVGRISGLVSGLGAATAEFALWLRCRIRAGFHLEFPGQAANMAASHRWRIPVLSGD